MLRKEVSELNGQGIRSMATAVPLQAVLGEVNTAKSTDVYRETFDTVVAGEASDLAVCAYAVRGQNQFYLREQLPAEYCKLSSGHRELMTVLATLRKHGNQLGGEKGKTVLWLTDSTNLTAFLEKGSAKPQIQTDILEVYKLARRWNIVLVPIHLRREDPRIVVADQGSKWHDTDDWRVDAVSFREIQRRFGQEFDLDMFADTNNSRTDRFFSRYICPGTLAVDALAQRWEGEQAVWMCPPTSKIIESVKKMLVSRGMRGVLIVPRWESAIFWPFLFPDGRNGVQGVKGIYSFNPFVLQGDGGEGNTLMKGRTPFPFLALFFESAGSGRFQAGSIALPKNI